jgi:hypothetical protein
MNKKQYNIFVRECLNDFKHDNDHMSLLYLSIGLVEEVKELYDKIKDKKDIQCVISEAGDVMWYIEALKIKLSFTKTYVYVRGDLNDMTTDILSLIKKSVFFNQFEKKKILDLLSSITDRLILILDENDYNIDIATIMSTNRLKLETRYNRTRDTLYVNKDVVKEDILILNHINKLKQNRHEKN